MFHFSLAITTNCLPIPGERVPWKGTPCWTASQLPRLIYTWKVSTSSYWIVRFTPFLFSQICFQHYNEEFQPLICYQELVSLRFHILRTLPKQLNKYVSKQLIHIILCIDVDLQVPGTRQEFQMHRNQACSHQPAGTYICCFWGSWWFWTGIKHFSGRDIVHDIRYQSPTIQSCLIITPYRKGLVSEKTSKHWHYPCSDSGEVISCWLLLKGLIQSEPFFSI